jgi:hypothetical protein
LAQENQSFFMPSDETKNRRSDLKWCEGIRFTEEPRSTKKDDTGPRWRQTRLRFTGVYCSGIVSGMGWGIMILAYPLHCECIQAFPLPLAIGIAFACEAIGHEFGRQSQRDRREGRLVVVEPDQTKWTWRDRVRSWLLGEYCAGIISGIGLAVVVLICTPANLLDGHRWVLAIAIGLAMIVIGSGMNRYLERRQNDADRPQISHT